MEWYTARSTLFALNRYLSVVLALYMAFYFDLPNPWWAMVTVFLAQPPQPLIGAIWAKAIYRVIGTLLGVLAGFVIVPNLADVPNLMICALAGWIGLCLYIALLDRSPRSYIFMLAGYTVALVGLSAASDPTGIFDLSVARGEEIVIGVIASAPVQSVLFPRSVSAMMQSRLEIMLGDARGWISRGLLSLVTPDTDPAPRRIAADLTELNLMASDMRFEVEAHPAGDALLRALEERLVALLPLLSAIEDRLRVLAKDGATTVELAALLERISNWVATANLAHDIRAEDLAEELENLVPPLKSQSAWPNMLIASVTCRLVELIHSWEECLDLFSALRRPSMQSVRSVQHLLGQSRSRLLHVDHGMAIFSALVAACTIIAGAAFTIATRWEGGATAIGIAAVCVSLFAALDDPTPMVRGFLTGFLIGLPLAVIYEFAILPRIDGFVMLAVVLFPVIFPIGLLLTQPKYRLSALASAVGFSAGLALQPTFLSDFATFANAYTAVIVGTLMGLICLSLFRVIPVNLVIRRILRAGWRDLANLTISLTIPQREVWASRMLDRVGLLIPRFAQAGPNSEWELVDLLTDLRLGVSLIELRHLQDTANATDRRHIERILAIAHRHFQNLAKRQRRALPQAEIAALDSSMAGLLRMARAVDRHAGIVAAVGLRRGMFPQAPAYRPGAKAE